MTDSAGVMEFRLDMFEVGWNEVESIGLQHLGGA
jgi:hypothetical protein